MKRALLALALLALTALPAPAQDSVQDLPLPRPLSMPLPGLKDRLAALASRPATPENALAQGILRAQARQ